MNDLDMRFLRIARMSRWNQSRIAHDRNNSDRRIARLCLIMDYEGQRREANGQFGKGKKAGGTNSSKPQKATAQPSPTVKRSNVTAEYHRTAKPGKGHVTMGKGYIIKGHKAEIETAHWLRDTLGGDVELIPEAPSEGKRPDMFWRSQNWEVKDISSVTAADAAVRKALSQLNGPGGIILRCPSVSVPIRDLRDVINRRIERSHKGDVDVMIIRNGRLIDVTRHKK